MNIPFTVEQFFTVFSQYNSAIWPIQIVAYIFGVITVYLAFQGKPTAGRSVFTVLGAFWIWMGVVYHLLFFSPINPAARIFGFAFIVQGILFLYFGAIRSKIAIAFSNSVLPIVGAFFVLYGIALYPLLGFAFGHRYPSAPVFGVAPCPTTIFTFGVLLWARSVVPLFLIIIPLLWSFIGMSAAVNLRVPQDYGLVIAGVLGTLLIVIQNRKRMEPNQAMQPIGQAGG
jgi:hypothetical protein